MHAHDMTHIPIKSFSSFTLTLTFTPSRKPEQAQNRNQAWWGIMGIFQNADVVHFFLNDVQGQQTPCHRMHIIIFVYFPVHITFLWFAEKKRG